LYGEEDLVWKKNEEERKREFMKLHDVPQGLSERVMDYVVSSWAITFSIFLLRPPGQLPQELGTKSR